MFIRKLLGLAPEKTSEASSDTETVRRIVRELETMDPEKARYLAAFAFVLARVAHADAHVSAEETLEMERSVTAWGGLTAAQATLVVEIAKLQTSLLGATEDYVVTRQFKLLSTPEQREELLHALFAVSAADDSISNVEEALVRQIAGELGLADRDFLAVRSRYNHKRDVLKNFPGDR